MTATASVCWRRSGECPSTSEGSQLSSATFHFLLGTMAFLKCQLHDQLDSENADIDLQLREVNMRPYGGTECGTRGKSLLYCDPRHTLIQHPRHKLIQLQRRDEDPSPPDPRIQNTQHTQRTYNGQPAPSMMKMKDPMLTSLLTVLSLTSVTVTNAATMRSFNFDVQVRYAPLLRSLPNHTAIYHQWPPKALRKTLPAYISAAVVVTKTADGSFDENASDSDLPLVGPPIHVQEGDTLFVTLKNSLSTTGLSIHWHGFEMENALEYDGVVGVTQCPISPYTQFTYEFEVNETPGTYWWHTHSVSKVDCRRTFILPFGGICIGHVTHIHTLQHTYALRRKL